MKLLKKIIFPNVLVIIILVLAVGSWGCAAKDQNLRNTSEFRDIRTAKELHLRNESASRGMPSGKELPEMTYKEYERLGDVHFSRGEVGTAFVQYEKSLELNPDNSGIHYKKGLLFVIGRMNKDAVREFQEMLKKEPGHALSYEGLGLAYFQMNKHEDAEESFRRAVELDPKLWKAHNFLGIIYDYKKQYEMAVYEYEAAIALNSDNGLLYNNLGTSYYMAGEYERAINAFNKALAIRPAHSKIYNNLGFVLSSQGKYNEALEAFRKGGDEAQAYNNLGCVYLEQAEYEKAIRCFEKAIQIKPTFYTKASENLKKARMALESSLDSNVQPSDAQPSFDNGGLGERPKLKKYPDKAGTDLVTTDKAGDLTVIEAPPAQPAATSGALEAVSPEGLKVEKFAIWQEPENNSVTFNFRLRNLNGEMIKGYTFVLLKPENGSQELFRTYPRTPLKDGKPMLFKKGSSFSMARFEFIHGVLSDLKTIECFKTATVYVYSETGSLLFEKDYEINDVLFCPALDVASYRTRG